MNTKVPQADSYGGLPAIGAAAGIAAVTFVSAVCIEQALTIIHFRAILPTFEYAPPGTAIGAFIILVCSGAFGTIWWRENVSYLPRAAAAAVGHGAYLFMAWWTLSVYVGRLHMAFSQIYERVPDAVFYLVLLGIGPAAAAWTTSCGKGSRRTMVMGALVVLLLGALVLLVYLPVVWEEKLSDSYLRSR